MTPEEDAKERAEYAVDCEQNRQVAIAMLWVPWACGIFVYTVVKLFEWWQ